MKNQGFTLVEMLVTILIMGILLAVAIPNFTLKKANVEKQTKELYSALMDARLTAMTYRQRTALFVGSNKYIFKIYSSDNDINGTARSTINTAYTINKIDQFGALATVDVTADKVEFDVNGVVQGTKATFVIPPINSDVGKNCIVVHTTRTNIGRMASGTTCNIQ